MRRTPPRTDGSLALKLDFGTARAARDRAAACPRGLRLAEAADKYSVLEHRRRRAQMAARRLLDLMEEA
jgi:hypothetical protein